MTVGGLFTKPSRLMNQKVVTPVQTGVQTNCNYLNPARAGLDSGFRRNDIKGQFPTFHETINIDGMLSI
jgi:hypothetical protein